MYFSIKIIEFYQDYIFLEEIISSSMLRKIHAKEKFFRGFTWI